MSNSTGDVVACNGAQGPTGQCAITVGAGGTFDVDGGQLEVRGPPGLADSLAGTRLRPIFYAGADGARTRVADLMFDAQRNERCRMQAMADGKTRCIPLDFAGTNLTRHASVRYFRNAGCTGPEVIPFGQSICSAQPGPYIFNYDGCAYDGVFQLGSQVTPVSPGLAYDLRGTTCSLSNFGAGTTFWGIGPAIPLSAFVEVTTTSTP